MIWLRRTYLRDQSVPPHRKKQRNSLSYIPMDFFSVTSTCSSLSARSKSFRGILGWRLLA